MTPSTAIELARKRLAWVALHPEFRQESDDVIEALVEAQAKLALAQGEGQRLQMILSVSQSQRERDMQKDRDRAESALTAANSHVERLREALEDIVGEIDAGRPEPLSYAYDTAKVALAAEKGEGK